ncbi:hypothetical protein ADK47_17150 [Streptomyces rimosus subsp. rimosus]|nr:hypothetical protein DF17_30060 [Streptomyces rimosus]KOG72037.1 hypothetical protein ADK78_22175 [Kitasatospora aureofaciens]KOT35381.1 hypothetical protein ADK42_20510 [Streptomyces rimosus subsp. rimosus]KOT38395.1 hypothetical protein ADK84_16830 [Streptomyces sp. NRRL WC-3701]KOT64016.1 hypothetical protein ADK45_13875 [Streptomyces rimosus subsp. rimosus]
MRREEGRDRGLPSVPFRALPGRRPAVRLGAGEDAQHRIGIRGAVVESGVAAADQAGEGRGGAGDDRSAAGQGLQGRQTERFRRSGRQRHVRGGLEGGEFGRIGEVPQEHHGQPLDPRAGRQTGPQRPVPGHHQRRVHTPPPQLRQDVQRASRPLLRRQPRAQQQEHTGPARTPAPQLHAAQPWVTVRQVDTERGTYDIARTEPGELGRGPLRRADHPAVGVRGPEVDPVRGGARRSARDTPGPQHAVHTFVGHHHRRDTGPPRPLAGPPQRRTVRDLQAVGGQHLQDAPYAAPVGQYAVAARPGQHRAGQGDHAALVGGLVAHGGAGDDQDRFVARGAVAGAQGAQSRAQPARLRGHEVREPYDAQPGAGAAGLIGDVGRGRGRSRRHTGTAVRRASTSS